MKIKSWPVLIMLGLSLLFLFGQLHGEYYYECFVVHGCTSTTEEILFCVGINCIAIIGFLLLATGCYFGLFRSTPKDNDTKKRVE